VKRFWTVLALFVSGLSGPHGAPLVALADPAARSTGPDPGLPPVPVEPTGTLPRATSASRPIERAHPMVPTSPPPSILPLAEVQPGMIGEAWTVFQGTKPEPFRVKVISILRNFIPKQDIILVRAEDPRVQFSGIAAGMSGSPIYVGGKLMGAISYGWAFSKEPLAGVTPIESMLAERQRPRRANDDLLAQRDARGLPHVPAHTTSLDQPNLQQVSVPLSVSGVSQAAFDELTQDLKPFGLVPVRAGGSGRRKLGETFPIDKLEPGAPVGVELVRGDLSAVAMGTLTYVQGNTLVAFGHPMFGIGEVNLPLVVGEVHAFLPSLASSFKMASPLAEIGAVVQDRPSCIVGDLSRRATMVPIDVRVTAPDLEGRTFHAEVARNRRLTPMLASLVITSAIADTEPDITEMAVTLNSRLAVRGFGPLELKDQLFSSEGMSPRLLSASRGVRALGDLLSNPFEPAVVDRLDIDVRVEFRRDLAEIVALALPGDMVRAGDTVPLRVTLRPYAEPEYTVTVPVKIPTSLGGGPVKVEVASGSMVRPDVPKPESLRGFIDNLRSFYPASSIVVSLNTPDDGASVRGRLIPNLPEAALDTLRPGNQTRRADSYRVAERTVFPSPRPVTGRQELTLYVREDTLGKNR
jgi:SpoIVB peptidase S55